MNPIVQSDDDVVWLTPPKLAVKFNKNHATIFRWCTSGFILTLGWKLYRDHKHRYHIGIPRAEYIATIANHVDIPSL